MFDIKEYFEKYNLFDINYLKEMCHLHHVNISTSERFPNFVLLKYSDECQYDKLWSDFSRACRGLVVDMKNHTILAHGFNKFHNLNEMPFTQYELLKDEKNFEVSEKLDGSCLLSFKHPNDYKFYLTTTGSFDSEHGKVATEMFQKLIPNKYQTGYFHPIEKYATDGTLMFELIDSRFRIVIDYKKKPGYVDGLYLIGYRPHNGELYTYAETATLATELGLPCMKTYQFDSLDGLLKNVEGLTILDEGFVLRYHDGLMVKIKGAAYLKAHRFISQLSDKHILESMMEGEEVAEELALLAPEEYKEDVIAKIAYFKGRKVDLLQQCYQYYADAPKDQDRKTFALWVNNNVKQSLKGCMFSLLDNHPLRDKDLYVIISKTEKPSKETRI